MKFDFSRANKAIGTAIMALNTVYTVQADISYDTFKNIGPDNKDLVVLRTVGGRGNIEIDGFEPKIVTSNTILVFEHNKVKRYFCSGQAWDFWWFEFSLSGPPYLPLNTVMQVEKAKYEHKYCMECLKLLRRDDIASKALASATLNMLICSWIHDLQDRKGKTNYHQEPIDEIIAYMHSHLSENLTVADMADIVGLSERHFREVFRDITGFPPKEYYDKLRMNMARELLSNTSLPIAEISYDLGYSSQFHFSKAFKKHYGMPPSAFCL